MDDLEAMQPNTMVLQTRDSRVFENWKAASFANDVVDIFGATYIIRSIEVITDYRFVLYRAKFSEVISIPQE